MLLIVGQWLILILISEINSSILKINTINYLQDVNEFVENIDFYEKITENEKKTN